MRRVSAYRRPYHHPKPNYNHHRKSSHSSNNLANTGSRTIDRLLSNDAFIDKKESPIWRNDPVMQWGIVYFIMLGITFLFLTLLSFSHK